MAVAKTQIESLLDDLEPQMRQAFMDAVSDIQDEAVLKALVERLEAGDLSGAVQIVDIQPVHFTQVADIFVLAFRDSGVLAADSARTVRTPEGGRLVVRFDARNPRAEEFLRVQSSRLVRGLTDTARDSLRASLASGMERGLNPRTTALDTIGRISRRTGRREGGVIGLTPNQAEYVRNARDELASGDPALMSRYFGRQRRDARFDALVRRAIVAGKPVATEDLDRVIGRYSDKLLQLRGETIARTETLLAVHEGQYESMRQAVESGKVAQDAITEIWHTNLDGRERRAHMLLNGRKIQFGQTFVSPVTGAKMRYPGDRTLGAGAEDVANCRCHAELKVDYLASVARRARGLVA